MLNNLSCIKFISPQNQNEIHYTRKWVSWFILFDLEFLKFLCKEGKSLKLNICNLKWVRFLSVSFCHSFLFFITLIPNKVKLACVHCARCTYNTISECAHTVRIMWMEQCHTEFRFSGASHLSKRYKTKRPCLDECASAQVCLCKHNACVKSH